MENKYITDLRWRLQQLSSQELSELIQSETRKEAHDDDLVLMALRILEERDAGKPIELGPKSQAALEDFRKKAEARARKAVRPMVRLMRAASIVLVLGCFLFLLPQKATAGSMWKILTDWTDDFFQYRNIGSEPTQPEEYVFRSDNPGLHQVYEAVVEHLGVTEPVVVQWLPEGNELTKLELIETNGKASVYASFQNGTVETVLAYNRMEIDHSPLYFKEDQMIEEYEVGGIRHNYMRNEGIWTVSWTRENLKCSIYLDCQEETLKQVIRSIY